MNELLMYNTMLKLDRAKALRASRLGAVLAKSPDQKW
jgi:hypothetical protein